MNNRSIFLAITAALALFSCSREQNPPMAAESLVASIESILDEDGAETRTTFAGYDEGTFYWSSGDQVAVHYGTAYAVGTAESAARESKISFATAPSGTRNYYAVYPAASAVEGNYGNNTLQVTLPDTYDLSAQLSGTQSKDYAPCPMIAVNDASSGKLTFRHVGGLVRIHLGGKSFENVEYFSVDFGKDITGTYNVSGPSTGNPKIQTAGSASKNAVRFKSGSSTFNSTGNEVLNVPVPCGTYEQVTVRVLISDGTVHETVISKRVVISRSHGKKLSLKNQKWSAVI